MAQFLGNPAISTLTVITISPLSLLAVMGVLIPVLLLLISVPLLFIRGIKPMQIIRSVD